MRPRLLVGALAACAFVSATPALAATVNRLEQRGYVQTARGRNGGIRLRQPAADIRVGSVVRDIEEELAVIGCLEKVNFCSVPLPVELSTMKLPLPARLLATASACVLYSLMVPLPWTLT